jgi:L-amino acid N-acyltransferase YncA
MADQTPPATAEAAAAEATATATATTATTTVTARRSAENIVPATVADLRTVLDQHARYWGGRDLRALHLSALVQQFPATCLVAVADDGIRGYLFGFVTPDRVAYVHLIATRDDARGTGLGRRLYAAFIDAARTQGAQRLAAITSVANTGSIAFHRSLGFTVREVEDYDGPGETRIVFSRPLDPESAG